eukprot:140700-Amphidinium_carterae.1
MLQLGERCSWRELLGPGPPNPGSVTSQLDRASRVVGDRLHWVLPVQMSFQLTFFFPTRPAPGVRCGGLAVPALARAPPHQSQGTRAGVPGGGGAPLPSPGQHYPTNEQLTPQKGWGGGVEHNCGFFQSQPTAA